jgi:hypothetical protein
MYVSYVEEKSSPVVLFFHRGLDTPLLLEQESRGTRQFLKIFPLLHLGLLKGGARARLCCLLQQCLSKRVFLREPDSLDEKVDVGVWITP